MLILSGLPGSGKTHARNQWYLEDPDHRRMVNYDQLRLDLYGPDWVWNRIDEDHMKRVAQNMCDEFLAKGYSVCIDNTNLTAKVRQVWVDIAGRYGVPVVLEDIDIPVEECVRRDRQREGRARVGRAVIERMALFHGWIDWSDTTLYPRDFIIVDMDGTLASCEARRQKSMKYRCATCKERRVPGEVLHATGNCDACGTKLTGKINHGIFYQGCEADPPIAPIVDLVKMLVNQEEVHAIPFQRFDVLIVSGRPVDLAGKGTEAWIEKHLPEGIVRHLFMRQGGDYRPDYIVKEEILEMLPKGRIRYVLDDRNQVVEMWRKHGLTCLQVAEGNF